MSHDLHGNGAVMKIIVGVLEEEPRKAVQMQEEYEKALAAPPCGVLVKKYVKGYQCYYLVTREGGTVYYMIIKS